MLPAPRVFSRWVSLERNSSIFLLLLLCVPHSLTIYTEPTELPRHPSRWIAPPSSSPSNPTSTLLHHPASTLSLIQSSLLPIQLPHPTPHPPCLTIQLPHQLSFIPTPHTFSPSSIPRPIIQTSILLPQHAINTHQKLLDRVTSTLLCTYFIHNHFTPLIKLVGWHQTCSALHS